MEDVSRVALPEADYQEVLTDTGDYLLFATVPVEAHPRRIAKRKYSAHWKHKYLLQCILGGFFSSSENREQDDHIFRQLASASQAQMALY